VEAVVWNVGVRWMGLFLNVKACDVVVVVRRRSAMALLPGRNSIFLDINVCMCVCVCSLVWF